MFLCVVNLRKGVVVSVIGDWRKGVVVDGRKVVVVRGSIVVVGGRDCRGWGASSAKPRRRDGETCAVCPRGSGSEVNGRGAKGLQARWRGGDVVRTEAGEERTMVELVFEGFDVDR